MQPSDRDLHWVKAFATAKQPRCGDKHRDPSPQRFQASVAHRVDRVGRDGTVSAQGGARQPVSPRQTWELGYDGKRETPGAALHQHIPDRLSGLIYVCIIGRIFKLIEK